MAPKRARAASGSRNTLSSSSESASHGAGLPEFVSDAARQEFNRLGSKAVAKERGFLPGLGDGNLRAEIMRRHWEGFCESPMPVPLAGVREFYANAKETQNGYSMVRGFIVDYTPAAIRRVLRLPTPRAGIEDWGLKTRADVDLQNLIEELCVPGTAWTTKRGSDEPAHFPASALNRFAKAWNLFICANIMLSTHQHEIHVDRAILLWSILTQKYIDLGALIHRNILRYLKGNPKGPIPHGSIVTRLCMDVGVGWSAAEQMQLPMAPIDHASIMHLEQWPGGIASEDGLGFREIGEPAHQAPAAAEAGQPPVLQRAAGSQYVGQAEFQQLSRRMTRRMDAMHDIHSRFAQDLTQALGTAFRATGVDIEWPVYGAGAVYPPPDSPPPEEGGPSGL